ncbi:uncharacterized protein LOC112200825 [Rosa chinensis]|uniref:uncharacterized protein LOC112200825 n=1 Tax=Rosa chinensis TaxID=74649 RepID=UPI000D08E96C|nr:uncharacterized protein LOC112200825 [Rosa chinensis]
MPFSLKNAGATYQKAMNAIFHNLIGKTVEVYIDDVVIKSKTRSGHVADLEQTFKHMRKHKLKMNPKKCVFGVSAGNFLGFLIHQRGIEVDKNKAKAIINAPAPSNKKQLQSFLGQVNFLRRFISNLAGKLRPFSSLLKLKIGDEYKWELEHQQAFDKLKKYLTQPPVLVPPQKGKSLKLYTAATAESIGSMLAPDNDQGKEQAIHYLSRILTPVEIRYSSIEKLCLVLYFSAIKLRHYMLPSVVHIISQMDLIKYMLTPLIIKGRIGKLTMALSEFTFKYLVQKSIKGQALAQFLADHPSIEIEDMENAEIDTTQVGQMYHEPWLLYFDGSSTSDLAGAGIVIESPTGQKHQYAFKLDFNCTNNQAEYEALIIGLEVLEELGATIVKVFGDSLLVINQMLQVFRCSNLSLATCYAAAQQLISCFHDVEFHHLLRELNREANEMAQIASGVCIPEGQTTKVITIERKSLPSLAERGMSADVFELDVPLGDWRFYIIQHLLMKTDGGGSQKIKMLSSKFTIKNGELLRKSPDDDLLLRCLGSEDAQLIMAEVYKGICGAHQAGIKMRSIKRFPSFPMNPIVKPWPFRGWAMDIIGQISPPSSKQHKWILVATDYFTKWVEAVPFTSTSSAEVIRFIEQHIIHRFGIPETITTDRGSVFIAEAVIERMAEYKITMQQSTPYYA